MNQKRRSCIFYIVRHGETDWNVKGIIQGQKNPKINKNGFKQALSLAKKLKKIKFNKVFSSDLIRAKRTADILALDHKLAVVANKLLRERHFGKYQGKKGTIFQEKLKDLLEERNNLPKEKRFKFKLQNDIESDEEVISRLITFLRETAFAYPEEKILIVCHGGLMRLFLIHLGFVEYNQLPSGSIKNTAYFVLESDGIEFFVKETYKINASFQKVP